MHICIKTEGQQKRIAINFDLVKRIEEDDEGYSRLIYMDETCDRVKIGWDDLAKAIQVRNI